MRESSAFGRRHRSSLESFFDFLLFLFQNFFEIFIFLRLTRVPLFFSPHVTVQSKSVSKVVKADIYPEFGTYPGGGESPIIPFGNEKNAEREVIHGRWAMLGVTGAWTAENGTGIPWFTAGTLCTPDDCTAVADKFPGAVAPLAPEGSGYRPSGTF